MTHFHALRKRILELDPSIRLQEKFPSQVAIAALWYALIGALAWVNLTRELPLLARAASSLVIGLAFSSMAFFNHELLHGSVVKSRRLAHWLSYPGFFMLALSPELWKTWHNHLHHFNTNQMGGRDPDLAGDWPRLRERKIGRLVLKLLPGSGHPGSFVFMFLAFTAQCLNVTWIRSRELPELYRTMDRRRVVIETLAYYAVWLALIIALPFPQFVTLLLVPLFITNAVIINYVGVPHNMRPLSQENLPLHTAISLKSPKIVDWIYFNFSHHCEHHIFPEANQRYLPRVREILLREYAGEYCLVPHAEAIRHFYTTPRAYLDDHHLFDPGSDRKVNLIELAEKEFVTSHAEA